MVVYGGYVYGAALLPNPYLPSLSLSLPLIPLIPLIHLIHLILLTLPLALELRCNEALLRLKAYLKVI
jgi:hypothetical protein